MTETDPDDAAPPKQPRLWRDHGWTARVVKNDDDEGWAVAMTPDGHDEPALVGPWTMGRDKKSPKPLDAAAFNTLVKTAAEVIRRHEQQRDAERHKSVTVPIDGGVVRVTLDIVADDVEPHGVLSAFDAGGDCVARERVAAGFRLDGRSAARWVDGGFGVAG